MVHEVGTHQDGIYTVAFGRRGQTLVSGGSDGVGYVWDLRPRDLPPDKPLKDLWNDLIGDDSGAAYKAMWALADKSEQSIPLLTDKLRASSTVTPLRAAPRDTPDKAAQPSDPGALRWIAARRVVAVLSDMGSAQAIDALRALSTQAANAEVRQFATDALDSPSRSQDQR
jgi:hypothetical protein